MAYIKALVWLTGFGGASYVLLNLTTTKDSDFKSLPRNEVPSYFVEGIQRSMSSKNSTSDDKSGKVDVTSEKTNSPIVNVK